MARIAFLLLTLFGCVGCGDGSDKVIVVGNQGPRVDHTAVAIGDFNGDGYNDLVAASSYVTLGPAPNPDEINVYLQNPRNPGSFRAPADYRVGSDLGLQTLSIVDLELDQLPDVVAWSITDGHLRVMLQKPSDPGALSSPAIYPTPGGASSSGRFAIADLNMDGLPDMAAVGERQISYRLQDSGNPGTFLIAQTLGKGTQDVAISDLNDDGLPDIAAFGVAPEYSFSEDLLVYLQSPMVPGVFQDPMLLRMGGVTGRDLVLADLDGDEMLDIAASGNITETFDIGDWYINVFTQSPLSQFRRERYRSPELAPLWGEMKVLSINSDDRPDLVAAGRGLHLFTQSNSGALSATSTIKAPTGQAIATTGSIMNLDVGDLNMDGLDDIAFVNNELFVVFQRVSGGFGSPVRIAGQKP